MKSFTVRPLVSAVSQLYNRARVAMFAPDPKPGVVDDKTFARVLRKAQRRQRWGAILALFALGGLTQAQECQVQQAVHTAAGTVISICASTPATFDTTGYTATNMVFTPIGEITDGGEHGKTYAEVTHKPIGSRGVRKFKGSFDIGKKSLQLALDQVDAGQIIAKQAADSDNDYSFCVAYPNGDKDFFQAKVMSFVKGTANVDAIVSAKIDLSLTASNTGVGVVEYLTGT